MGLVEARGLSARDEQMAAIVGGCVGAHRQHHVLMLWFPIERRRSSGRRPLSSTSEPSTLSVHGDVLKLITVEVDYQRVALSGVEPLSK